MQADSLVVMALMAGFLSMLALGIWVRLADETRADLYRAKGQVLAGAGAAGALMFVLLSG